MVKRTKPVETAPALCTSCPVPKPIFPWKDVPAHLLAFHGININSGPRSSMLTVDAGSLYTQTWRSGGATVVIRQLLLPASLGGV